MGLNVDDFFTDAVRALLVLYDRFPQPTLLEVESLCGPTSVDEYGLRAPRHQACFSALLWLGEEGYLRYGDTIRSDALDQAVLSGRSFLALTLPRAPADTALAAERSALIGALRAAHEQRSSNACRAAVLELMQALERAS